MGRGDGHKKKKKKKKSTASAASMSAAAAAAPVPAPRVSNDINVPVKLQIKLAQMHKAATARSGSTSFRQKKRERTKYRRTWTEEEAAEKAEQRRKRGRDPDWEEILSRNGASKPVVFVDGYNIIYKWSRLKKHMLKGDPARARQMLLDDLENLAATKRWRIECVFDGTRRNVVGPLGSGPGGRAANRPTALDKADQSSVTKYGVTVVYSGVGSEADTYIEGRLAAAKNATAGQLTEKLVLATDDAMIRAAGRSAGAVCMSADLFVTELKASRRGVADRVEAAVAAVNGHAIRPKQLRNTYFHTFGRRSVLIEDKRQLKKEKQKQKGLPCDADSSSNETSTFDMLKVFDDIQAEVDENGVPWWAVVPNQTRQEYYQKVKEQRKHVTD